MASSGHAVAWTAFTVVGAALLITVFADAAAGFTYGSWKYGPYLKEVLSQFDILVAVIAITFVVVLLK